MGISWSVRTFLEGLLAAGKNSSTNGIHSALSTHESGNPAEALRWAMAFSNWFCQADDQVWVSGTSQEDVQQLAEWEEVRESWIVWCNIGEVEAEAWELSRIDRQYGRPSANGTGRGKLDIAGEASTEADIGSEVNDGPSHFHQCLGSRCCWLSRPTCTGLGL